MGPEKLGELLASSLLEDEKASEELRLCCDHENGRPKARGARRDLPVAVADGHELASAGWGVIVAKNGGEKLLEPLRPLLDHRREQARKRFFDQLRYDPDVPARDFLWKEHGTSPGVLNLDRLPYYLLIAGDPETIPFAFQYQLSLNHAVGRIAFDRLEEYERYARNVVRAETLGTRRERRAILFTSENGDDNTTDLMKRHLVDPLADRLGTEVGSWQLEIRRGARKEEVLSLFRDNVPSGGSKGGKDGDATPGLLIGATHGRECSWRDSERQEAWQGALVCQDWPGGKAPLEDAHCLAAEDAAAAIDSNVDGAAGLDGLVAFFFACYGAGSPVEDNYPHWPEAGRTDLDARPGLVSQTAFVARLPRVLLSRGALAVVGHVDMGWTTSFSWIHGKQLDSAAETFEDVLKRLLRGDRLGHALRPLAWRYAKLAAHLAELEERRRLGELVELRDLGMLWTAHNDARNFVVIGDPAVYLLGRHEAAAPRPSAVLESMTTHEGSPGPAPWPAVDGGVEPDLLLLVEERREGRLVLDFRLHATDPELELRFQSMGTLELHEDPRPRIQGVLERLQDINAEESREAARHKTRSLGVLLAESFLTPALREILLKLAVSPARTLLVLSNENWIPWEAVKLGDADGEPYLGEAFAVSRGQFGTSTVLHLPLRRMALVAPENSGLPKVAHEVEFLRSRADRRHEVTALDATFERVAQELSEGRHDAWHFAGHGHADAADTSFWSVELEDREFEVSDLLGDGGNLRRHRPLVFFNGCHTGHGALSLHRAGGWPALWLGRGAGAFIGPAWAVTDRGALTFAEVFYREFRGEQEIAEAARRARLAVREAHPGDPTWLAYTVHAHPRARCAPAPNKLLRKLLWPVAAVLAVVLAVATGHGWYGAARHQEAVRHATEGAVFLEEGSVEEARRHFEDALAIDPRLPEVLANLAMLDDQAGDAEAATEGYRAAIELDVDNPIYHFNLGTVLVGRGHTDEAVAALERAIELDPSYAQAMNELGNLYLDELGWTADALRVLKAGAAACPEFAPLHKNLARALIEDSDAAAALPHLRTALGLYDHDLDRMEATSLAARAHDLLNDSTAVCAEVERYERHRGSAFSPWLPTIRELTSKHGCPSRRDPESKP